MKKKKRIVHIGLVVGVILFIVLCGIASGFNSVQSLLQSAGIWGLVILCIATLGTAVFTYTTYPHVRGTKRFYIIRGLLSLYGIFAVAIFLRFFVFR